MSNYLYRTRMGEVFIGSSVLAALKASWTASTPAAIWIALYGTGADIATLFLMIGTIVSLIVASLHTIFVLGLMTKMYPTASRNDSAGQLFGRWWVWHNLSVWVIPAILILVDQAFEEDLWGFLLCVAINSNAVLWLFCQRYVRKREQIKRRLATKKVSN
ncbi:MAG: hypothetical protein AAGM67_06800 [Bacteroidota bacterium]